MRQASADTAMIMEITMEEKNSYLSADPETIRQIDEKMPPEEELQDLAEFFKVFGDATR